ncbi:DUF4362 domain-containing protein [Paenibacillus tepidiphilus]|uniref:DUF4362 domain-containing protein n=1 Tax=Paenibacillus tepidiphilus TaxID=2608683 RepID=UPI0013A58C5D|nr:DUF4362 domain-containing protein [Paenibacillus tepidiphilus]
MVIAAIAILLILLVAYLIQRELVSSANHEINWEEDVIIKYRFKVKNVERLDTFMERKSGSQRVVQLTVEGDPIFEDLQYKRGKLEYTLDTTEDAYGPKVVRSYTCSALKREETETMLSYTLTGCDGEVPDRQLLRLDFDPKQLGSFGFVLKYGFGRGNEINTPDGTLVKDLLDGTAAGPVPFKYTQDEMQQIYRRVVLADYLADKEVSEACNIKPYASYELSVAFGSREQHYTWSECDNSRDGQEMTGLAEYIIGLAEETDVYRSLPEIRGYVH